MSGRGKNYLQFAQYFDFLAIFWLGLPSGELFQQHSPLIKFKFFSSATSILLLVRALKRSVGCSSHKPSRKVTQAKKSLLSLHSLPTEGWVSLSMSPPSIYKLSHEPHTGVTRGQPGHTLGSHPSQPIRGEYWVPVDQSEARLQLIVGLSHISSLESKIDVAWLSERL